MSHEIAQVRSENKNYEECIRELKKTLSAKKPGTLTLKRLRRMKNGPIKSQVQMRVNQKKPSSSYYSLVVQEYSNNKNTNQKDAQTQKTPELERKKENYSENPMKSISFNLLDIPAELAYIYSKLDNWEDMPTDRNIVKFKEENVNVNCTNQSRQLPSDINCFNFKKFLQLYIKDDWKTRQLSPLNKPFLSKVTFSDMHESLSIFKMILRYVNTNEYDLKRDKILADYIVQKGLSNPKLRDEIFVQIINQTWNNTDVISNKKASHLMSQCLSCFAPSPTLYKYLLKYISDYCEEDYKAYCQMKIFECNEIAREYPPTYLEWISSSLCANMALEVSFIDSFKSLCEINSWTRGEELSRTALLSRNINPNETNGWTLGLRFHNESEFYELNGLDYVFDLINETENSPLILVMNNEASFTSSYLTSNKNRNKTLTRSGCSTDWYLEAGSKFQNNLRLEQSIKGTKKSKNNKESFSGRCYKSVVKYNYLISKKQYDHLNNLLKYSEYLEPISSTPSYTQFIKTNERRFLKNLAHKIKGSGRETKVSLSAPKSIKLANSIVNVTKDQQDFLKFLSDQAVLRNSKIEDKQSIITKTNSKKSNVIYEVSVVSNGNMPNLAKPIIIAEQPSIITKSSKSINQASSFQLSQQIAPPPVPPPPPPIKLLNHKSLASQVDLQSRAKTIRIGKVRWPPAPNPSITFEYELKKKLDIQREIHHAEKLNDSIKEAEEEIVQAIKDGEEKLRLLNKSNKSITTLNFENEKKSIKNDSISSFNFEDITIVKKESINKSILSNTIVSIESEINNNNSNNYNNKSQSKISPLPIKKTKKTIYKANLKEFNSSNKKLINSVKLINRSTSITGSDLSYTQINKDTYNHLNQTVGYALKNIETKLFDKPSDTYYSYTRVSWSLILRKEVFTPNETIESSLVKELLFLQIINDFITPCHGNIRIGDDDRIRFKRFLDENGYLEDFFNKEWNKFKIDFKEKVIEFAKSLPFYFCRIFQIENSESNITSNLLTISHSGIRLIKYNLNCKDAYTNIEHINLADITEVNLLNNRTLSLVVNKTEKKILLSSQRSHQLKAMIDQYCSEIDKKIEFVQAIRDYVTNDQNSLLSFRKNNIIKLTSSNYTPQGWCTGILNDRQGLFPTEYVRPLSSYEANTLKESALLNKSSSEITYRSSDDKDSTSGSSCKSGKMDYYSMMEFAMLHFKSSLKYIEKVSLMEKCKSFMSSSNSDVIEKLKNLRLYSKSRDWTWVEYADMVKFTKLPIQTSLLKLETNELTQKAIECFIEIMKFMGDYPLEKNQIDLDCVCFLIKTLSFNNELCDEVYCQLMKQTTSNKSSKSESCQKGWKLFSIICSYFKSSELLRPYLFKYLENNAYDSKRNYYSIAQIALNSLKKTFKYGGRRIMISQSELEALLNGRVSRRQMFLLPGAAPVLLNIRNYTVVQDCIEQISGHLGITNQIEQNEFAIYYAVETEKKARPLGRSEYIYDITTDLTKLNHDSYLIFKRVLWFFPIRSEFDNYVDMMFNQMMPDYNEGLVIDTESIPDVRNKLAYLSALQFKANDKVGLPTLNDLNVLLPINLQEYCVENQCEFLDLIKSEVIKLENYSIKLARSKFLEALQKWPLFGATFFYVKNVYDSKIHSDCLIAINKHGLYFLTKKTRKILIYFKFNEIISTRRYKDETNTQYVDLKTGNLMLQRITKIETDYGNEISIIIGQYIDIINKYYESSMKSFSCLTSNTSQKQTISALYLN